SLLCYHGGSDKKSWRIVLEPPRPWSTRRRRRESGSETVIEFSARIVREPRLAARGAPQYLGARERDSAGYRAHAGEGGQSGDARDESLHSAGHDPAERARLTHGAGAPLGADQADGQRHRRGAHRRGRREGGRPRRERSDRGPARSAPGVQRVLRRVSRDELRRVLDPGRGGGRSRCRPREPPRERVLWGPNEIRRGGPGARGGSVGRDAGPPPAAPGGGGRGRRAGGLSLGDVLAGARARLERLPAPADPAGAPRLPRDRERLGGRGGPRGGAPGHRPGVSELRVAAPR